MTTTTFTTTRTFDRTSALRHTRPRNEKDVVLSSGQRHQPLQPPLRYYPAYCFPASPTFGTWAHLSIADVRRLDSIDGYDFQSIYFHLNHPIKYVRLVGIIIAFDQYETRNVLTLDDGSGATIEVGCRRTEEEIQAQAQIRAGLDPSSDLYTGNGTGLKSTTTGAGKDKDKALANDRKASGNTATDQGINLSCYDVGSIVKVKGLIKVFRGTRQLELKRISPITSTTQEMHAWEENTHFRTTILSTPWYVSPAKEQQLFDEANGARRREQEKIKRHQARKRKQAEREKRHLEREKERQRKKEKLEEQARLSSRKPGGRIRSKGGNHRNEEAEEMFRGNPLDVRPGAIHVPIRTQDVARQQRQRDISPPPKTTSKLHSKSKLESKLGQENQSSKKRVRDEAFPMTDRTRLPERRVSNKDQTARRSSSSSSSAASDSSSTSSDEQTRPPAKSRTRDSHRSPRSHVTTQHGRGHRDGRAHANKMQQIQNTSIKPVGDFDALGL
ncbi:hypothetical protein L228DRAFT_258389 [Xylona heveae TC161]|uniref:CST complex subunit Stn1 N-terminal domain-containing protein n=1 Tax=Xylona heveae (strain CBS 132557 / TC161) TaxID=1328760 RepID=A0A165IGZ3_XYLHT|nr:hypothetical protein L228DRAFT_258389 [Xylona heveae TC161]KZF24882.1 hypothetical protein L228DRAFT_258389 [Xylona heveae TC161]